MNALQELPEIVEIEELPSSAAKFKPNNKSNRRNGLSLNLDQMGQTNNPAIESNPKDHSLNIKFDVDDERLKTESDERQKTEERRLLKLEVEDKTKVLNYFYFLGSFMKNKIKRLTQHIIRSHGRKRF